MRQDRLYAILSALPAMMLIAGLVYYYKHESDEAGGALLQQQSQAINGAYKGISAVNPNSRDQYYLWITTAERDRGLRLLSSQLEPLANLQAGDRLLVQAAPRVEGSKTLWVYRVERDGSVLLDDAE
ncbi:MAG: hypothetical protein KDJ38_04385 [Gammaproteobacteria bacterium]|nr:hypothetical protein [Gammaproteobacteria bacterium]